VEDYLRRFYYPMALLWVIGTQTGYRISDLLRLTFADVHNCKITIRESKTKKYRTEVITFQTMQNLSLYASNNGLSDSSLIWPFTRQYVWRIIKKAGEACNLPNLGPHSMRKTYAWMKLIETSSVEKVQATMLHEYQSTTLQYLKPGLEKAVKKGQLVF